MLQRRVILNTLTYLHHHCICDSLKLNSGNPTECKHIRSPSHLRTHINLTVGTAKGKREEPHLKSPGNFSCLATSRMCQTSPPTLHISHIPQECLLFYQVERMNPVLRCVSHRLCAAFGDHSIRQFHLLVQFVLCLVISFSAVQLKIFLLPVSIYVYMG